MKRFLTCLLAIPLWPIALIGAVLFAAVFPIGWIWATITDP